MSCYSQSLVFTEKKYSTPFAEKIIQVIDDTIRRIETIGRLTTIVYQNQDDKNNQDIHKAKTNYITLQESLENHDTHKNLDIISDIILQYIKRLSVLPWGEFSIQNIELSDSAKSFCDHFGDFRTIIMNILTQTSTELNQEQKFIEKYSLLPVKNKQVIAKLEQERQVAYGAKDLKLYEKQNIANDAQQKINLTKEFIKRDVVYIRDKTKVKNDMIKRQSKLKIVALKKLEKEWQEKVKNVRVEEQQNQKELKERIHSLEKCVTWVMKRYDEKMMELQEEFDKIWSEFLGELKQCRATCIEYEDLAGDVKASRAEKRRRSEQLVKEQMDKLRRARAARCIQRVWKAYKQRKVQEEAPPPQKGKKKK